jgi:hypothetical protein
MGTYSAALFHTGSTPAAERMASESVRILEAAYGREHVHLIGALNNLAQVVAVTRPADAEPLYRRALAVAEKRHGSGHPDTAKVQANFGAYYASIGRMGAAESMYRNALATLRAGVGESHPVFQIVQERLSDVYVRTGRRAEAKSIRRNSRSFVPELQIPAGFAADRTGDGPR